MKAKEQKATEGLVPVVGARFPYQKEGQVLECPRCGTTLSLMGGASWDQETWVCQARDPEGKEMVCLTSVDVYIDHEIVNGTPVPTMCEVTKIW